MADTRHIQVLDKILDALGGLPPGSPTLFGMATLNSTASLINARLLTVASNVSETNRQLVLLNTTASHVDGRLAGLPYMHPRPDVPFVTSAVNPPAGNTTLQSAGFGEICNIIHKIRLSFVASHNSPGREISLRDGAAGSTYFTTRVPPGFFTHEIDLPTPFALTANTAAVCFVATGFSAIGIYEVLMTQNNPSL